MKDRNGKSLKADDRVESVNYVGEVYVVIGRDVDSDGLRVIVDHSERGRDAFYEGEILKKEKPEDGERTTANSYEAKINAILTARLPESVETDDLGSTIPAAQYRAEQLSSLSQEIRRIMWSPEVKVGALAIAARADQKAAELTGGAVRPLPRFDSFVSGGHIVPAIQ